MIRKVEIYLLSIEELNSRPEAEHLCELALQSMDVHRREKAQRIKAESARNLAIGAGLLLQMAVRQMQSIYPVSLTVSETLRLLKEQGEPILISYCYDPRGKPDFADGSLHFNLSHSGQYVCCVLAEHEIGIDIQYMRPLKNMRLAERFFSDREKELLRLCGNEREREELFYRIWVRKEAYAKLTGQGIVSVIGRDVTEMSDRTVWQEYDEPAGYRMAVCRYEG